MWNKLNEQISQASAKSWRKWVWGLAGSMVLILAAIGVWAFSQFQPTARGPSVTVVVKPGESTTQIADDLEQAGLIRNAYLFRLYLSIRHSGHLIQAGEYAMTPGTAVSELIAQMEQGRVVVNTIRVTIPEGFTVRQIASRLEQMKVCSSADFLAEVQHGHFQEAFLSQLPTNPLIRDRLEGYLFPDTYDFVRGESAHQVIDEMLKDFQAHLTPTVMTKIKDRKLTLAQVITEASIVEKEAKVNFERPIIASVMNNRLHHQPPMKLQIDATVLYVIGHHNVVTDADTLVKSPYNTYQNYGLPPGPIANPGLASILAVLNPAHTTYLYYVVKNDGTGEAYFASTWAQQLHNMALSQANLNKRSH